MITSQIFFSPYPQELGAHTPVETHLGWGGGGSGRPGSRNMTVVEMEEEHSSSVRCLGHVLPPRTHRLSHAKSWLSFPNLPLSSWGTAPTSILPFCHVTCFCHLHLQWSLFQGKPGCFGTLCLLSLPLSLVQGGRPAPGLLSVFAGPLRGLPACTRLPVSLPAASGTMSSLVLGALGFLVVPECMLPPCVWTMEGFVHIS